VLLEVLPKAVVVMVQMVQVAAQLVLDNLPMGLPTVVDPWVLLEEQLGLVPVHRVY